MFALVIPFHADFKRLESTLEHLKKTAAKKNIKQILLCHNGTPLTKEAEQELRQHLFAGVELLHTDKKGIGAGYKIGIEAAKEDVVVLSASDLPFGYTDIDSYVQSEKLGNRMEIAIGSKAHPNSNIAGYGLKRRMASAGFWAFRAFLLGPQTPKDTQGSVLIRKNLAKRIVPYCQADNYFFTVELITYAQKFGSKAIELPVVLENHEGESSVSVVRDSWKMARDLIEFSKRLKREK